MDHLSGRLPISLFEGGEASIFSAAVRETPRWTSKKLTSEYEAGRNTLQHITTICCSRWWLFPNVLVGFILVLYYLLRVKQTPNFSLMEVFLVPVTQGDEVTQPHPPKKGSFSSNALGNPKSPGYCRVTWTKVASPFLAENFLGIFGPSCLNVIPTSPFRIWLPWHDHKWPARNLFAGKRPWNSCMSILWKALWTQRLACSKPPEFFRFFQLQVQVFPPCSPKKTAMDANRQRPWRLRCAALASLVSAFVLPAFVLPSQCAPHTTKSPRQDARVTMYIVTPGPDSDCVQVLFQIYIFLLKMPHFWELKGWGKASKSGQVSNPAWGGLLQGSRAKTKRGPPKYHMPTGGPNVTKTSDLMELRVSYTVDTRPGSLSFCGTFICLEQGVTMEISAVPFVWDKLWSKRRWANYQQKSMLALITFCCHIVTSQ